MGRGRVVGIRVRAGKGELHLLRVRVKAHPHKTDSSTLTETKGRPAPHISSIIEWRRAAGYRRRYQHCQAWTLCSSLKQKPWVLKHLCLPEVLTNLSSWGAWKMVKRQRRRIWQRRYKHSPRPINRSHESLSISVSDWGGVKDDEEAKEEDMTAPLPTLRREHSLLPLNRSHDSSPRHKHLPFLCSFEMFTKDNGEPERQGATNTARREHFPRP